MVVVATIKLLWWPIVFFGPSTEIACCHLFGAWNFEVFSEFLENLCTPALMAWGSLVVKALRY
jgi:hypothetical protein